MVAARSVSLTTAAIGAVLVVASGCSGGCSGWSSFLGGGRPDDSATALAGRYGVDRVRRVSDGCLSDDPDAGSERAIDGVLRLRITDSGTQRRAGTDAGDRGEPATNLELTLCEGSGTCRDPSFRAVLRKSPEFGWMRRRGTATATNHAGPARWCRLAATTLRVRPKASGIELRRMRREQVVALEGDASCSAQTALDYGEQLPCVSEERYEAAPADET